MSTTFCLLCEPVKKTVQRILPKFFRELVIFKKKARCNMFLSLFYSHKEF